MCVTLYEVVLDNKCLYSEKVVNGLDFSPGTHVCRAVRLVGKLEVIKVETVTIEKNDNPVHNLEKEAADCYRSIIL